METSESIWKSTVLEKCMALFHWPTQCGQPAGFRQDEGTHEALMSSRSLSWSSRFRLSTSTLSSMFFKTRLRKKRNNVKYRPYERQQWGNCFQQDWLQDAYNRQMLDDSKTLISLRVQEKGNYSTLVVSKEKTWISGDLEQLCKCV